MQATENAVLDRIVELWRQTPPVGQPERYDARTDVDAASVWSELERQYGLELVRNVLAGLLREVARRESAEERMDSRLIFLTDRCFVLSRSVDALRLDVATVKHLICTLPAVGYYGVLGYWVKLYFDQPQLLRILAEGIRTAENDWTRASCVFGLRMYFYEARPSDEPALCDALQDFEASLRGVLARDDRDATLFETSESALKQIWKMRAKRSECARTGVGDLRAYRSAEGDNVSYGVERIADGYLAIRILGFGIEDRVFSVEYRNQEPSLLPEDVPAVLEATLLRTYFSDRHVGLVDRKRFVDAILKTTSERPA